MRLGARPADGASGPWSDLPGGQPRAASSRPPRLPDFDSKRMNQLRPGVRPPRFLFSFSTPRAAGAARLHRRSFPGTLPLMPLSALGVPGPSSMPLLQKDSELSKPARPPTPAPGPSPQPLSRPVRRLAVASLRAPSAARFEAEPDRRGRERA